MEIVLAVGVAVIGWLANHMLTIRAQNKAFIKKLRAEALNQILLAAREYRKWLGEVEGLPGSLNLEIVIPHMSGKTDWFKIIGDINKIVRNHESMYQWMFLLEEHEILFPETAKIRKELVRRHEVLDVMIYELQDKVLSASLNSQVLEDYLRQNRRNFELRFLDQQSLLLDLGIIMQNQFLSHLMKYKIPDPKPLDDRFPRIVLDNGKIRLIGDRSPDLAGEVAESKE